MKSILISLLILIISTSPILASNWTTVAARVHKSIVYLAGPQGSCTAFSINQKRDYILTAAHCDQPDITADGLPAQVVTKNTKKDLLVLFVDGLNKPALQLAKHNPEIGDEVASYGYGLSLDHPLFRIAHISADKTNIPLKGIVPDNLIAVDAAFVIGQSGGPIVNQDGDVVMIAQATGGTGLVGFGVGAEDIKSKVGEYFSK